VTIYLVTSPDAKANGTLTSFVCKEYEEQKTFLVNDQRDTQIPFYVFIFYL